MAGLLMAAVFPLALDGVLAAAATPSNSLGVFDGQSDVGSVSPPGTARFDAGTGTYRLAIATAFQCTPWGDSHHLAFISYQSRGDAP